MLCKSQVVSRGIVDSVELVVIVIHGEDFGGWASKHSSVVEPKLVSDELTHILNAFTDTLEEVDAFGLSVGRDLDCFEDGLDVDVPLF